MANLPRLRSGQPLIIQAREWNRHCDTSDFVHANLIRGQTGGSPRRPYDTNAVTVKNNSGANRRAGDILEFTGLVTTDLSDGIPWLTGGSPSLANGFGVCLQAIPSAAPDNFGPCLVSGCCVAYVNMSDADHKYATVTASTYVLQSSIIGPVRILFAPSGTGEKQCFVKINDVVGECLVKNATGSDIAASSSGTFQLWTGTPGSESYANCDITAYNKSSVSFKNGKFGALSYLNGYAYACPWQT